MANSEYVFVTDCVNSDCESISDMTEKAKEITYRTFIKHIPIYELLKIGPFSNYDTPHEKKGGLKLKNDWHVSYHKSTYQGHPCLYVQHSSIEYIFQLRKF